jgi:hypothetical protein
MFQLEDYGQVVSLWAQTGLKLSVSDGREAIKHT